MTIAVVASTTGTGTTLARYVELLGEQLGTYVEYAVSTTATVGEAARLVLLDELRDDEEARDAWGGGYCYARSGAQAGAQRRVLRDGYEGPLGGLVLSRPWPSALVAGSTVALSKPLPVREYLGVKSLTDCVNEALARVWVPARLTLVGNGTDAIDLSAYPWLALGDAQTRGIYDTLVDGTTAAPRLSPGGSRIVTNGVTRTLVTDYAYAASDTFYLDVLVRGDTLISDDAGASWGYTTTPGLVADTDQAAAPPEWVVAFGMRQALRELLKLAQADRTLGRDEKLLAIQGPGGLAERRREWARACVKIQTDEFPPPLQVLGDGFVGGPATETTVGWV